MWSPKEVVFACALALEVLLQIEVPNDLRALCDSFLLNLWIRFRAELQPAKAKAKSKAKSKAKAKGKAKAEADPALDADESDDDSDGADVDK